MEAKKRHIFPWTTLSCSIQSSASSTTTSQHYTNESFPILNTNIPNKKHHKRNKVPPKSLHNRTSHGIRMHLGSLPPELNTIRKTIAHSNLVEKLPSRHTRKLGQIRTRNRRMALRRTNTPQCHHSTNISSYHRLISLNAHHWTVMGYHTLYFYHCCFGKKKQDDTAYIYRFYHVTICV